MDHLVTDIENFLAGYKDKDCIYVPNPGNAGDCLIAYATVLVLDKVGVKCSLGSHKEKFVGKTIFYGGGGNLIWLYKDCANFLKNNMEKNDIVVLPHTVTDVDDVITSLNSNVTLFCREKVSYEYVKKIAPYPDRILLSKDMALHLRDFDTASRFKGESGEGVGNCFRNDREKTTITIPGGNKDVSIDYNLKGWESSKTVMTNVTLGVLAYLSRFETINTNRLHVAIAGSLLGKKVNFHNNSYYKNKAVYEFSLNNDPNVVFFDQC